jgi:hypothetical protein
MTDILVGVTNDDNHFHHFPENGQWSLQNPVCIPAADWKNNFRSTERKGKNLHKEITKNSGTAFGATVFLFQPTTAYGRHQTRKIS